MPSINHELLINAPAEKIYDAVTNVPGLSAWWTPNTQMVTERNVLRFHFGPDYFKEMEIIKQEFPYLEWLCTSGAEEWKGTSVSFQLHAHDKESMLRLHPEIAGQMEQHSGNPTLLIFRHDNWPAQSPMFAECNYTWAMFLRSLKSYCETGKGNPWPNQHK